MYGEDDCMGLLAWPPLGDFGCSIAVVVVARMGTHSRSMAIMFPIPLRFSHIPSPITIANIHAFILLPESGPILLSFVADILRSKSKVLRIRPGRRSAALDVEEEEEEEE